jgi:hypothetical protein
LKVNEKEIYTKTKYSWSKDRKEDFQEKWSDELEIQLLDKYE